MAKIHMNITLDYEVHSALKDAFINISGTLNDVLHDMLISRKPETKETFKLLKVKDGLKLEIAELKREAKELKNKKSVTTGESETDGHGRMEI